MFYSEHSEEDRAKVGVSENVIGGSIIVVCLTVGFVAFFGVKAAVAVWHFFVG